MPHTFPALRRTRNAIRAGLALLVVSTLLGASSPARAQSTPPAATLGGFSGSAAASALHVEYDPEGLLATGSPVDVNAPDALATIASGPSTFARAAVADPGDLLANPDALLSLASSDYPQGAIPPWPFRISADSGVGAPEAESNPAPGLQARVTARGGSSTAEATAPGTSLPAVVTLGSQASYAETTTDGSSVTVHSRSEIHGLDILGVIHIESIVTDLTATSSGSGTTLEGGTVVTGATFAGTPAEIDDDGVRSSGIDLSSVLDPLGIAVTLPGPTEAHGGDGGQLASNGLRIEILASGSSAPALPGILDGLPPIEPIAPGAPGPEDLLVAARANHVTTIELGRGLVSLTARTPGPRRPATTSASPDASPGGSSAIAAPAARPALPSTSPAAPLTPSAAPAPVAAPAATAAVPAASVSTGIGALAALLLILQPFIGDRLARIANLQLATDQEGCPWERS